MTATPDNVRAGSRTVILNQWFDNRHVKLDGYHFIGCRFDRCTLVAETTDFELSDCFFVNCTITEAEK